MFFKSHAMWLFLIRAFVAWMGMCCSVTWANAQEPAFLMGSQAMRYEEAPGYFHYLGLCRGDSGAATSADAGGGALPGAASGTPTVPAVGTAPDPAVCWTIRAIRVRMADGKQETSSAVSGMLRVFATKVRFTPFEPANGGFEFEALPSEVGFQHKPGSTFAALRTKDAAYQFAFISICRACVAGSSPIDASKAAQLDAEFQNVGDSLRKFDSVFGRLKEVSLQVRIEVRPGNQPSVDIDPPEAMGLYARLNEGIAAACPVAAQACLKSYATYQECKAAGPTKECGTAPTCVADCAMAPETYKALHAKLCLTKDRDSATLLPDWRETVKEMTAAREARGEGQVWAAKGNHNPDVCGVLDQWGVAQLAYNQQRAGISGTEPAIFGGISGPGVPGGMLGAMVTAPMPYAGQRKSGSPQRVSGEVVAGLRLSGAPPAYPPLAKAAHVSGAVKLFAVISKAGDIESLSVISGPELLRASALDAVRQWKYKPFLLQGKPTEVDTVITVNFNFGDGKPAAAPGLGAVPDLP